MLSFLYDLYNKKEKKEKPELKPEYLYIDAPEPAKNPEEDDSPQDRGITVIQL